MRNFKFQPFFILSNVYLLSGKSNIKFFECLPKTFWSWHENKRFANIYKLDIYFLCIVCRVGLSSVDGETRRPQSRPIVNLHNHFRCFRHYVLHAKKNKCGFHTLGGKKLSSKSTCLQPSSLTRRIVLLKKRVRIIQISIKKTIHYTLVKYSQTP
jgi:hypothetical protein